MDVNVRSLANLIKIENPQLFNALVKDNSLNLTKEDLEAINNM